MVPNSHEDAQWYLSLGPVICLSSRPHSGLFAPNVSHAPNQPRICYYSLVDSVDIVLRFDRDAPVARNELVLPRHSLRALELRLPVVPVACVQHHGILIRRELGLDAAETAAQPECHFLLVSLVAKRPRAVVPVASVPAVVLEIAVARRKSKLVGCCPEVVDAVLAHICDFSRRQCVLVRLQYTLGLGCVQGVVPDGPVAGVLERVELEVRVLREHQRRPHLWRHGVNHDAPLVLRYRVRHAGFDVARHALRRVRCIVHGERDGRIADSRHVPHSERPVVRAAMQRVRSIVLLRVVNNAIERVRTVSNAVDITPGYGIVDWMARVHGFVTVRTAMHMSLETYGSKMCCRIQAQCQSRLRSCL